MGLDNGIYLRSKVKIPQFEGTEYDVWSNVSSKPKTVFEYEFLYWRKWWGFRNEVVDYLSITGKFNENDYSAKLDVNDLIAISNIYKKYMDEEYWNENADSIWSYDEVQQNFDKQLSNFAKLMGWAISHPKDEIIFYDSY